MPARLLTIAHSYCVALNRRLADELARAGGAEWEVTAVAPAFFEGDLRPVLLEHNPNESCHLESVPVRFSRRIHVMQYGPRLREILWQGWDLVHCWEEPYIWAGGQVARWTPAGTPLVYATFQNIAKRYPPPFNWIERKAMRRANGWIAFGRTVEETLRTRPGYAGKPSCVIPLGVDTATFKPDAAARAEVREALAWQDEGPPVAGYLGRFVPEKGLPLLTRSLDGLPCAWRALLVGSGPLEKELRRWAARHGDRVRVVTGVTHSQAPKYLNAMDLLCAPSRTTANWREQLGRMLLEAFACGVPVIASASGEIPHVMAEAGRLVAEDDAAAWARGLRELLTDRELRHKLGQKGLARAQSHYAWPHIAQQHWEFFRSL